MKIPRYSSTSTSSPVTFPPSTSMLLNAARAVDTKSVASAEPTNEISGTGVVTSNVSQYSYHLCCELPGASRRQAATVDIHVEAFRNATRKFLLQQRFAISDTECCRRSC
eukprot:scaffold4990_cov387-Prasinococcus_capsulatus_cf.AAC.7